MKKAFLITFLISFSFLVFPLAQKGNKKTEPKLTKRQKEELALLQKIKIVENDPQKKAPLLEEFCKKFPDSQFIGWAHYQAIFTYQKLNRFKDMERHALIFMKMYPQEPSIPTLLTYGYAERGKYQKALKLGEKTLKQIETLKKPQNVPQEKWDKNVSNLKSILYSSLGEVYFYMGEKEKSKKKLKESEKNFLKALKLNPRDDITNYRLGLLYYIEKKLKNAEIYLSNAVVLSREISEKAKKTLLEVLKEEKKSDRLEKILSEARKRLGINLEERNLH